MDWQGDGSLFEAISYGYSNFHLAISHVDRCDTQNN